MLCSRYKIEVFNIKTNTWEQVSNNEVFDEKKIDKIKVTHHMYIRNDYGYDDYTGHLQIFEITVQ